jgi:hypothetical protein
MKVDDVKEFSHEWNTNGNRFGKDGRKAFWAGRLGTLEAEKLELADRFGTLPHAWDRLGTLGNASARLATGGRGEGRMLQIHRSQTPEKHQTSTFDENDTIRTNQP